MTEKVQFVTPRYALNLVKNPVFRWNITDYWTQSAGGTHSRSTFQVWRDVAAYRMVAGSAAIASAYAETYSLADGVTLYIACRAYPVGITSDIYLRAYDLTNTTYRITEEATTAGEWNALSGSWTNNTGGAVNIRLYLINDKKDGSSVAYFDEVYMGTQDPGLYFDGDTPGCKWVGTPHNSYSIRPATTRHSGALVDPYDDYGLNPTLYSGFEAISPQINIQGRTSGPGSIAQAIEDTHKAPTIVYRTHSDTATDTADNNDAFLRAVDADIVPRINNGRDPQPLRFKTMFHGESSPRWGLAHRYGPTGGSQGPEGFQQSFSFQLMMEDPYFYGDQSEAYELDRYDSVNFRYCAGRLQSTGQWSDLGLTSDPTTGGSVEKVLAAGGLIYHFGNYQGMNGVAGRDYAAIYDPYTDTWSTMDSASVFNGIIRDALETPDGKIVIVGDFTNADGDANADYVAQYNPSTGDVSAFSTSGSPGGTVNACAWYDGELYVTVSTGPAIYKSSGGAWTSLSVSGFFDIPALCFDDDGVLYAGGYTGAFPTDTTVLKSYDGSSWTSLVSGDAGRILSLRHQDSKLFVTGTFIAFSGTSCGNVCWYDPNADFTTSLSGGIGTTARTHAIYDAAIAPDGRIWVVGNQTTGYSATMSVVSIWSGGTGGEGVWSRADASFGSGVAGYSIAITNPHPKIESLYDVYIGMDTSVAGTSAGDVTVTNSGTAPAYPKIVFRRDGGTSLTLYSLRNETTGTWLRFEYSLEDGEYLEIDCHPDAQTITSNYKGAVEYALLPGASLAEFKLLAGDNLITCYAEGAGTPTTTAHIYWYPPYKGAL